MLFALSQEQKILSKAGKNTVQTLFTIACASRKVGVIFYRRCQKHGPIENANKISAILGFFQNILAPVLLF